MPCKRSSAKIIYPFHWFRNPRVDVDARSARVRGDIDAAGLSNVEVSRIRDRNWPGSPTVRTGSPVWNLSRTVCQPRHYGIRDLFQCGTCRGLCANLVTKWEPRGDHVRATWGPRGDHVGTTWGPRGGHVGTTWEPRGDHVGTT